MGIHRKNEKHPGFPTGIESMGGAVSPPPPGFIFKWGSTSWGVCVGGGGEKIIGWAMPPSTIGNPDIYVHMLASHFSHAQKKQTFQTWLYFECTYLEKPTSANRSFRFF